ncbi:MAG: hypothetical protein Q4C01_02895 [Clostridia bacterium]|nr:hypothetical protein [Clostridia bacterium]
MSFFEAAMLFCFGLAWPVSLVKSYKSRSTGGKSLMFSMVVVIGYAFGILHKIFYHPDIVLILYIINLLMISADVCLWFRNRHIEKKERLSRVETAAENEQ